MKSREEAEGGGRACCGMLLREGTQAGEDVPPGCCLLPPLLQPWSYGGSPRDAADCKCRQERFLCIPTEPTVPGQMQVTLTHGCPPHLGWSGLDQLRSAKALAHETWHAIYITLIHSTVV